MRHSAVASAERVLVCDGDGRTVRALRLVFRDAGFRRGSGRAERRRVEVTRGTSASS
jgi:hypothetical protein